MGKHQSEKWPEALGKGQAKHRKTAEKMAKAEEFLCSKLTVAELIAEKHSNDGRDREGIENPRLLSRGKT